MCPTGTFTAVETGATHQGQCQAQCRPGTWSQDGLDTCRTCPMGHHQSQYASTSCTACEPGHWTLARGANSVLDCKAHCPPGKTSDTGLEPCYPCPRGYFQDQSAANHCYKCPNKTTTAFHSSASIRDCIGLDLFQLRDMPLETLEINDCFSIPCQNDATCVPMDSGFQCQCQPGFQGSLCEIKVDPCLSSPCLNHGTCSKSGIEYKCTCLNGFTGKDCEIDIDECAENKCTNNGTCYDASATVIDSINDLSKPYICDCEDGFQGEFCEENIDDCQNHGCENNGQCIDGIGSFSCVCSPGFTGRLCEDEVDECASSPCHEGATCVDGLDSFTCMCGPGKGCPLIGQYS